MLKGAEQYQSIVRVPFIWSDPQASRQPKRTGALGSTIDIGATVLDRAKIEPFSGMQAKSLLPVFDGKPVRDSVFIQYDHQHPSPGSDDVPPRVHTLIDGRWRSACSTAPAGANSTIWRAIRASSTIYGMSPRMPERAPG